MVAKPRGPRTADEMAGEQRDISVSEFFVKNRHLLGFDNPLKALLTTVKEGVDNALDACEEAGILPEVLVEIRRVGDPPKAAATETDAGANGKPGTETVAADAPGKIPDSLFQRRLFDEDVSEEEESAKAVAAAARGVAKKAGRKVTDPPERFVVVIEDNGPGIVEEQIGKVFGKLLYGSKFHRLRQSLTADQPVVVERGGRVERLPIGSLVDGYLRDGEELADVSECGLRVPAFDRATGRYRWRTVSHVIRHERANEVLRVRTEGGRSVQVTGCHSLFTFDPSRGCVAEVEARTLRAGDFVVAPMRLPAPRRVERVHLLEELSAGDIDGRALFVYDVPERLFAELRRDSTTIHRRGADGRSRRYFEVRGPRGASAEVLDDSWHQYERGGFLPIALVKRLGVERDCAAGRLRTYHHGAPCETPATWELTPAVMRLLGLFVAEGHSDRRQVGLTFAARETHLVEEVVATARTLGLSSAVEPRPRNAVRVKLFGGAVDLLFPAWCGRGAKAKRVPWFVFGARRQLRQHFLDGLHQGDGHLVSGRDVLMLSSTSEALIDGVDLLWRMQGVLASRNGPFVQRGLGREPSRTWRLDVHGRDISRSNVFAPRSSRRRTNRYRMFPVGRLELAAACAGTRIPATASAVVQAAGLGTGPAGASKSVDIVERVVMDRAYSTAELAELCGGRVTRHLPEHLVRLGYLEVRDGGYVATGRMLRLRGAIEAVRKFAESDLCLLRIEKVETVADGGAFVYDLSVPSCENFVAGEGALACHNSRGQQGIGISAAGMYGQLTTGRPVRITSKTSPKKKAHYMEITLDLQRNHPEFHHREEREWEHKGTGTRVEIELEAKYQKGQRSVDTYLRATALANPHVTLVYRDPDGTETRFERATKKLPEEAREVQPHPYGVELGMLLSMFKNTQNRQLGAFLENEFSRVSKKASDEICALAGLNRQTWVTRVAREEAASLHQALGKVKLMNPPTDCISPIGEGLLIDSLAREYPEAFIRAVTRAPSVYRGNPFQIEVALAYGPGIPADQPAQVLRFANRVPLLYQQGACAINKGVVSVPWRNYGVEQPRGAVPVGPIVLVVHLASVWVPFTSESKEAVAHYPEILKELRLAIMDVGRSLKTHISKTRRVADEMKKREYISKYIPKISEALQHILEFDDKERDRTTAKLTEVLNRRSI